MLLLQTLNTELHSEKVSSRQRHALLVDDLTMALQTRDTALTAIRSLQSVCQQAGIDTAEVQEVCVTCHSPLVSSICCVYANIVTMCACVCVYDLYVTFPTYFPFFFLCHSINHVYIIPYN